MKQSSLASQPNQARGLTRKFVYTWAIACGLFLTTLSLPAEWQLTWSDEFNGDSINTNQWVFDIGNGKPGNPGWGNDELEFYRLENARVSDGLLHITARAEDYGGQHYTSARMKTRGLFSQARGRFEFRARLPQGKGYWPAIWLLPQDTKYGRWAASGEIDVMENRGDDPSRVLGTIHFGGEFPKQTHSKGPSFTFPAGDSVTNFHIYAIEWATNSIKWYVDSTLYETQTNWWSSGGKYPVPFDQPFYIVMNLAVGGRFGGNPDTNTVFPGEMQVDYVRVYRDVPTHLSTSTSEAQAGHSGSSDGESSADGKELIKVKLP